MNMMLAIMSVEAQSELAIRVLVRISLGQELIANSFHMVQENQVVCHHHIALVIMRSAESKAGKVHNMTFWNALEVGCDPAGALISKDNAEVIFIKNLAVFTHELARFTLLAPFLLTFRFNVKLHDFAESADLDE